MAILFAETLFYLVFASGKEQSWNTLLVEHSEKEEEASDIENKKKQHIS